MTFHEMYLSPNVHPPHLAFCYQFADKLFIVLSSYQAWNGSTVK